MTSLSTALTDRIRWALPLALVSLAFLTAVHLAAVVFRWSAPGAMIALGAAPVFITQLVLVLGLVRTPFRARSRRLPGPKTRRALLLALKRIPLTVLVPCLLFTHGYMPVTFLLGAWVPQAPEPHQLTAGITVVPMAMYVGQALAFRYVLPHLDEIREAARTGPGGPVTQ